MSSSSGFVLQRRTGFTKIEPEWFENNKLLAKDQEKAYPKKSISVGTSTVKESESSVSESESKYTSHITVPVLVHGVSYLPVVVAGRPYALAVPVATSAYATLDTRFVSTSYYDPLVRIVPGLQRF